MQTDSLGKMLPQILLPFARQWAERSGMPVLSKLLVDEQFVRLIEKYADELTVNRQTFNAAAGNGNGNGNGYGNGGNGDMAKLHARVAAMESQQQAQQAIFEILRARIRPLALALGCCPECLVGLDGCPKCLGQSGVGRFEPDQALLRTLLVNPLAARGVPLTLGEAHKKSPRVKQPANRSKRKRSRS